MFLSRSLRLCSLRGGYCRCRETWLPPNSATNTWNLRRFLPAGSWFPIYVHWRWRNKSFPTLFFLVNQSRRQMFSPLHRKLHRQITNQPSKSASFVASVKDPEALSSCLHVVCPSWKLLDWHAQACMLCWAYTGLVGALSKPDQGLGEWSRTFLHGMANENVLLGSEPSWFSKSSC